MRPSLPLPLLMAGMLSGCGHATTWSIVDASGEPQPDPRPHIVLVIADDLGWGDVGFQGQREITTPNIDRMAGQGMVFSQFYAGSPICAPSRAVLTTGRHAGRVAVRENLLEQRLLPSEPSIAEVMKEAGYRTALIGKWGLGGEDHPVEHGGTGDLIPEALESLPTRRGFDYYFGYLNQLAAHEYYPESLWKNEERFPIPGNFGVPKPERTVYSHDLLTGEVLRLIGEADADQPLFLQVSYILPHRETIPPPGVNPYADRDWPEVEKAFAAMVTYLDGEMGMIADAIDSNPATRENTLLIFTSDNGPQATDGHSPAFFQSSGPFRGAKRDLYEGGIRVPFVAVWPGRILPGTSTAEPADFADLLPTFADLGGGSSPEDIDGRSIKPLMTGSGSPDMRPYFVWIFLEPMAGPGETPARVAVLQHPWKLIIKADGSRELYHLDDDPGESHNLAPDQPTIVGTLESIAQAEIQPPLPGVEW